MTSSVCCNYARQSVAVFCRADVSAAMGNSTGLRPHIEVSADTSDLQFLHQHQGHPVAEPGRVQMQRSGAFPSYELPATSYSIVRSASNPFYPILYTLYLKLPATCY